MSRERLIAIWLVLALALGVALIASHRLPSLGAEAGRGKVRQVPMELLRRRIEVRRLSDKEALFYKKVGEGVDPAASGRRSPPANDHP